MAYGPRPRWPSPAPAAPPPVPRTPEPPTEPPRRQAWIHVLLSRAAELSLVLAMCLLFFGGFLLTLTSIFPEGTGIRDMIEEEELSASWRGDRVRLGGDGIESGTARLRVLAGGVSWKPANEIAWGPAETGQMLHERDGVQTSARGEALVTFDQAGEVRLGHNSMIIIREPGNTTDTGKRRSSLFVLEGELWGHFTPGEVIGGEMQLEASGAMARIAAGTVRRGEPEFKVSVSQGHRTTFAVYSGTAEIQAGNRTIRVGANRFATVDSSGVAESGPLPDSPRPLLPAPDARKQYRGVPPQVTFMWREVEGVEAYRLLIARDAQFRKVILDERTQGTEFVHGNLPEGAVYWRVSALRGETEGAPSRSRALWLVQHGGGPALRVQLPKGAVQAGAWTLVGETLPGTSVFVGGAPVTVDGEGRFRHEIQLTPGVNVLVVEAVDPLGNTSYESGVVHAR